MQISRFSDWEDRLRTYLDRVEEEPFQWGTHDCALFAADCVKAMTGADVVADFRGKYDTRLGAAEALREYGDGTLLKTMKAKFGETKSPHFAQRGDVVMRDATTTGICVGQFSYFVGEEQGLQRLVAMPTKDCKYAFTVPFSLEASEGE